MPIHYAWFGKDMPQPNIANILEMQRKHPGTPIHIWMDKDLFSNSYFKAVGYRVDQIPGDIKLHSLEELEAQSKAHLPKELHRELFKYIRSELIGKKNFAAASDIVRLIALHVHGGLYTDSKIKPTKTIDFEQLIRDASLTSEFTTSFIVPGSVAKGPVDDFGDGDEVHKFTTNNHTIIASEDNLIIVRILEEIVKKYKQLEAAGELDRKRDFPALDDPSNGLLSARLQETLDTTGPKLIGRVLQELSTEFDLGDEAAKKMVIAPLALQEYLPFTATHGWLQAGRDKGVTSYDDLALPRTRISSKSSTAVTTPVTVATVSAPGSGGEHSTAATSTISDGVPPITHVFKREVSKLRGADAPEAVATVAPTIP